MDKSTAAITVAILGCGTMGKAFAKALRHAFRICLFDRTHARAEQLAKECGGTAPADLKGALEGSDVVILAFKPKDFPASAPQIAAMLPEGCLVGSLLATVSLAQLAAAFPKAHLVRLMPNIAAEYGKSATALCSREGELSKEQKDVIEVIAQSLGNFLWIDEELMPGFIALAGSGPAFHCAIIEAMVDAAIALGFKPESALALTLQSMQSTIALLEHSKEHPAALRWKICTPRGTTIAGLLALEAHNVRHGVIQTILAAASSSKSLSDKK